MMEKIEKPVAEAVVQWRTADEGGRRSGPPTASVYMATAVFVQGTDSEVQPDWPASADQLSILLQKVEEVDERHWRCLVGFLAPELARPNLQSDVELLILEGPRVVASAQVAVVIEQGE